MDIVNAPTASGNASETNARALATARKATNGTQVQYVNGLEDTAMPRHTLSPWGEWGATRRIYGCFFCSDAPLLGWQRSPTSGETVFPKTFN